MAHILPPVKSMDGKLFGRNQKDEIILLIKNNPNADVTLIGYSRGGLAVVDIANALGAKGISVNTLITCNYSGSVMAE